ncbi:MAG: ankyrin repeat domain-containing protein, partial [Gammaproteobacteria bacterium]
MDKISSVCNSSKQWLDLVQNTATHVMAALSIPGFSRTYQYQDLRQASHASHLQQSRTEKTVTDEQLNCWIEQGKISMEQTNPQYLYDNEAISEEIRNFIANLIFDLNGQTDQDSFTLRSIDLPLALTQIADILAGDNNFPGFIPIPPNSSRITFFPLRDLRNKYSMSLIDMAIYRGYTEAIRALLAMGVSIDQRMPNGATLVHTAVNYEQTETLKILKELGANVDEPDNDRATPLFYAARKLQDSVIIRHLVEWGANVKARDKNGATPLHIAARKGKSTRLLLVLMMSLSVQVTRK